jgi:hypothetical protein
MQLFTASSVFVRSWPLSTQHILYRGFPAPHHEEVADLVKATQI